MRNILNTVNCPECGESLNKNNLEKHLKKVHRNLPKNIQKKTLINTDNPDKEEYSKINNLLTEPCTCRGNNENCFLCGGWGYIDVVGKQLGDTGRTIISLRGKKNNSQKKVFNEILNIDPQKKVANEILNIDEIFNINKIQKINELVDSLESKILKNCIKKNIDIEACQFSSDIGKIAKNKTNKNTEIFSNKKNQLKDAKKERIKVCKNARIISKPPKKTIIEPKNNTQNDKIIERRLDGTREYHDRYRDHGQFGSFPSHDCYGEESSP
jgi:hypothetical protein